MFMIIITFQRGGAVTIQDNADTGGLVWTHEIDTLVSDNLVNVQSAYMYNYVHDNPIRVIIIITHNHYHPINLSMASNLFIS